MRKNKRFNRKTICGLWAIDMRSHSEQIHMEHGEYEKAHESKIKKTHRTMVEIK